MSLNNLVKKELEPEGVTVSENCIDIIDNLHDIVVYVDLNNKIKWANQTALNEFNLSLNEIKGRLCYELIHNRDSICKNCVVEKAKKTNAVKERKSITPDGKVFLVRAYPIKNDKEEIIGFLEIALNITKHKNLEKEVENKELKNKFFSNLSHELKTPLNLISYCLQALELEMEGHNIDNGNRYIKALRQNKNRLLKSINNFIDLTKIESNFYNLNLQNHDIVAIIQKIVLSVKECIKNKDKELKFESELEEKIITCDPFNMERIILNLLSNAMKGQVLVYLLLKNLLKCKMVSLLLRAHQVKGASLLLDCLFKE
jgi:PAS domain S-box-containing protein